MNVSIANSSKGSNRGTCSTLVTYLNKENEKKEIGEKRHFFSHDKDEVLSYSVEQKIDHNIRKLGSSDAKFYMLTINPSQKELSHIDCSEDKLKAYTREIMEAYAANFNKGLKSKDLVWFAKIEEFRVDKKTKNEKSGLNWHVHVIISRRDVNQKFKLSPLSNHRNTKSGPVIGGFERNAFRAQSEHIFDEMFDYKREWKDTFYYQNTMKNGNVIEKDLLYQELNNIENSRSNGIPKAGANVESLDFDEMEHRKRKKKKRSTDRSI